MKPDRSSSADRPTIYLVAFSAFIILCVSILVGTGHVHAAEAETPPVSAKGADQSNEWIKKLGYVEEWMARSEILSDDSRSFLVGIIDEVHRDAGTAVARDEKIIQPLRKELSSLGPAPAAEAPAEAPEVVALRKGLQDRIARVDGRIQKARLALVRAENLYTAIKLRQAGEIRRLWQRSPEVLEVETWRKAGKTYSSLGKRILAAPGDWWDSAKGTWRPAWIVIILLAEILAILLAVPARRWLRDRLMRREATVEAPDETQRMIHAAQMAIGEVILPVVGFGVLAAAIAAIAPSGLLFSVLFINLCLSGMVFFVIAGLARAALAPADPRWRILPVTEAGAETLHRRVWVIAIYLALVFFLKWTVEFGEPPSAEFYAVTRTITNTAFAVLLLLLLPGRFWEEGDKTAGRVTSVLVRGAIALGLLAVPVLDFTGYSALASFVLVRLLVTVVSIGLLLLLRAAYHSLLAKILHSLLERWLRLPEGSARLVQLWLSLLNDIVIFGLPAYELLVFYGLSRDLLNLWLWRIFTGVRLGNVTISLVDILVAILVFLVGLTVTGWVRRWIARVLLSRTRMDIGVQESIASGIGYLGIVVSIVLAIVVIGIDLSNLALIAGALSVGVGFGLKTVVENFAAGLLLLIERPIKAGDWIVTSGREGIVRKISVRSTELETFDQSSVIVPNSELITQPVENWTHKNKTARIIVPVGVAYGSDTARVREVLLACAAANETVMNYPQPQVLFRAFGDSSLDFELRCFIPDAHRRISVSSDLHFAVDAAFREAGIEIAFPQRDLHIRNANLGESSKEADQTDIAASPPNA